MTARPDLAALRRSAEALQWLPPHQVLALLSELEALRAREAQPKPTQSEIVGAVARGWCHRLNMHKTMDPEIALAVASEVSALFDAPAPASAPTGLIEAAEDFVANHPSGLDDDPTFVALRAALKETK